MDDLIPFVTDENELKHFLNSVKCLLNCVKYFIDDIRMKFGLNKFVKVTLKWKRITGANSIELNFRGLEQDKYIGESKKRWNTGDEGENKKES